MTDRPARISRWEWIAAAVATAIVIGMVVTLFLAGRREQTPPRFAVTIDAIAASGPDFLVQFSIRNDGRKTAAEVMVEGRLERGDGSPETGSVTFDYVPGGSVRRGGLLFRHDPHSGQLTLRPLGFREP
ncbi:MAG: hypothetical protein V7647_4069 [Acidobacteriota bacterium]|jgi:uncharacterized protein (TIGR02588 family)